VTVRSACGIVTPFLRAFGDRNAKLPAVRSPAQFVPRIPEPARVVLRNAVWTYGRLTASARPLPSFLILGAQKAGTTALYAYLRRHPDVTGPTWKEVSFFDRHYARGEPWYRGNFPVRRRAAVGEASPSYVFHPLAPQRVAELVPSARLVVLLRNPVDRAYSHYQHEVALGREPLKFEDALAAEGERLEGEVERMLTDPRYFSRAWWNHTYRSRGVYAEQLERWFAVFPQEQLLVLTADELAGDTDSAYRRVLEHVGVSPRSLPEYPRVFEREYGAMQPETRNRLAESFAGPNRRLYELLGRDLGWG
jgi:Sulfotransferase domain